MNELNEKISSLCINGKIKTRENSAIFKPRSNFAKIPDDFKIISLYELVDNIKDVYGPLGNHFATVNSSDNITHITKDGKSFFEALKENNVLSQSILNIISEAADFVISKSGDGTTSVALLTCILTEKLISYMKLYKETYGYEIPKIVINKILDELVKEFNKMVDEKSFKVNPLKGITEKDKEVMLHMCRTSMNNSSDFDHLFNDIIEHIETNKIDPKTISIDITEELKEGGVKIDFNKGYLNVNQRITYDKAFADSNAKIIICDDFLAKEEEFKRFTNICINLAVLLSSLNSTCVMFLTKGNIGIDQYIVEMHNRYDMLRKDQRYSQVLSADFPIRFFPLTELDGSNYLVNDINTIAGKNSLMSFYPNSPLSKISIQDVENSPAALVSELQDILKDIPNTVVTYNTYSLNIMPVKGEYLDELVSQLEKEMEIIGNSDSGKYITLENRKKKLLSTWIDIKINYSSVYECTRVRTQIDDAVNALVAGLSKGFLPGSNTFFIKIYREIKERVKSFIIENNLIPEIYFSEVGNILDLSLQAYSDLYYLIVRVDNYKDYVKDYIENKHDFLEAFDVITRKYCNNVIEPAKTTMAILTASFNAAENIIGISRIRSTNSDEIIHINTCIDGGYSIDKFFKTGDDK